MSITRVVNRFAYPAEQPFVSLTLYYLLLFSVSALLLWQFPALRQMVSGERLAALAAEGGKLSFTTPTPSTPGLWLSWPFALSLGGSMIGAFLLMLPSSWVYMAARRAKGFDQTIVQTMVILAMAVAGVVVIVRNSLALAFSLAGIVGAVRFRNTLPDTRDTLFIFLAIGVGLAAGVEALAAGAVLSVVANYLVLLLWRTDYGMCELGRSHGHLLHTRAATAPGSSGKRRDFNSVVLVRTRDIEPAKSVVEPLLAREMKRWELAEVESNKRNGETVLKYLVRRGKGSNPDHLADALLQDGAPYVIGARVH